MRRQKPEAGQIKKQLSPDSCFFAWAAGIYWPRKPLPMISLEFVIMIKA